MGYRETKSLTESGVKHIFQFFFLQFCLSLPLLFFSLAVFFNKDLLNSVLGLLFYFGTIVMLLQLFILFWLFWAFIDLFNGRNEFGPKHSSNIVLSIIYVIFYSVLLIVEIILARGFLGGNALLSAAAQDFSLFIIPFIIAAIGLSIVSRILLMFAMKYSISGLISEEQKKDFKNAFYFLALGPITFDITGLIAYRILFKISKATHFRLHEGKLKPLITAPCPYCNRDIPIQSKICPYCGQKFEKDAASFEIDPRLRMDLPKPEYKVPQGYTPVEGPTKEEKKKVYRIIALIIALIIVISAVYFVFQIFFSGDKSDGQLSFLGSWQGGTFDGTEIILEKNWTFYENWSLKENSNLGEDWYNYEINNGELCLMQPSISYNMCYEYHFSNDEKQLRINFMNEPKYLFNKI